MGSWQILEGDALELLAGIDSESIDAIVTDPPYGLGFMGKEWDSPGGCGDFPMRRSDPINTVNTGVSRQGGRQRSCEDFAKRQARDARSAQEWHFAWATLAIRVLKPGAHLVAFGGTRTYHRLACALEDAGFEIRDSLMWIYGSGFPKSLDVSKAIDRAAGVESRVVGSRRGRTGPASQPHGGSVFSDDSYQWPEEFDITAPATDAARQWEGWGTALKPAHEPIVLARKPLRGTVAENVQECGTGALNVDGCRIETADGRAAWSYPAGAGGHAFKFKDDPNKHGPKEAPSSGRWPPNVLLTHSANCGKECADDCPAAQLDRQSPAGASRFFPRFRYEAKASTAEREAGLHGMKRLHGLSGGAAAAAAGDDSYQLGGFNNVRRVANHHPTVKPIALMRWLCRLVTPPGGLVLDPFLGSGTTMIAALREGFRCVGIERDAEYMAIARRRVEEDMPLFRRGVAMEGAT